MVLTRSIAWCALLAALTCWPLAGGAQTIRVARPAATPAIRSALPQVRRLPGAGTAQTTPTMSRAAQRGVQPNVLFGTIVQLSGQTLTLRTRDGRLHFIDATPAFTAGTVSAPLFIGKIVAADGVLRADGRFTAARISHLTRLDGLNPDR